MKLRTLLHLVLWLGISASIHFNNLPTDLRQTSHNIYKFQKALKKFLLDNPFYSLEEYYNWRKNVSS